MDPVPARYHVVPADDLREHALTPDCWCRPQEDPDSPGAFVHNQADPRELTPLGRRRPE